MPDLVITEINYNPPSGDPDTLEFIEMYNNGNQPAAIGGFRLGGVVSMTFPALTLAPGETFLVAAKKAACESFFTGKTFYQWNGGSVLTNGGNTLVIRNTAGVTIDSVQYDDAFPWPLEPDGQGPSAELLSPNLDNNDGANWKPSTTATADPGNFASPGVVEIATLATISFGSPRTLVQENGGSVSIPVTVTNLSTTLAEARVRVVSASTAVNVEDYILVDSVVTFPQGATTPIQLSVQIVTIARRAIAVTSSCNCSTSWHPKRDLLLSMPF
ncbi:MAG: lamin tail domain-containing protein [Lewinellaceae bacterium]|nr:lamin tail domain-containing protein [Lewinellaceae bacterium]